MKTKTKTKILPFLLLAVTAATMVFSTGAASASAEENCEHDYTATVYEATCTEQGYTEYTCSICGDSYTDDFTEATGHTFSSVTVGPTCTTKGFTTYVCTVCGYQYTDNYVDATGHNYSEVVVDPTCTVSGYT